MLDVFVTLFAVAAFLFAVSDLARDRRRAARDGEAQTGRGRWVSRLVLGRPWRLAAGAAAGAAIACKWSGGLVLIGVIGLTFAWELHARWTDGGGRPLHRTVRDELPSVVAWLLVAPLAVYLVSYTGRVPGSPLVPPWQEGSWLGAVLDHQAAMLGFHTGLGGHHPYESPPWSWLLLKRPVAYYFDVFEGGYQEILALGNPLVWWPSMGALAFLAIRAVRRRAAGSADVVALLGFAITLLPWVMLRGDRSQVFIFYLLPTVPFMCLALALAVQALGRSLAGRVATVAFLGAALTVFVFFYPILAALPIAPDQWRTRILFDDCATAARGVSTLPDAETASGDPPAGWCWR
jgi:dolichyl-phosphate-mannose--protein O-mannosyl transferase